MGWLGVDEGVAPPPTPARRSGGLVYDTVRKKLLLFGGEAPVGSQWGELNDTWEYDGTDWVQQQPPSSPPARSIFGMSFDAARGRAVVFGGWTTGTGDYQDTWEWDGATWTQIAASGGPGQIESPAMIYDAARGSTLLVGGYMNSGTWKWNGTGWSQVTLTGSVPTPCQNEATTSSSTT
jgi:hypothetical protein